MKNLLETVFSCFCKKAGESTGDRRRLLNIPMTSNPAEAIPLEGLASDFLSVAKQIKEDCKSDCERSKEQLFFAAQALEGMARIPIRRVVEEMGLLEPEGPVRNRMK